MDDSAIDTQVARRRRLHDRNVHDLVELLQRREELRGVYPMADLVVDNLGWVV